MLAFKSFELGMLAARCYVLWDAETRVGAIVDPGDASSEVVGFIRANNISIEKILLTHAHFDHIGGVGFFKHELLGVRAFLHEADFAQYKSQPELARKFGVQLPKHYDPELPERLPASLRVGSQEVRVIHTPGHTKGSVCFQTGDIVLSGDTLFQAGLGRVDLPGGDYRDLISSVNQLLTQLHDKTTILPGHGLPTTVGRSKGYWTQKSDL